MSEDLEQYFPPCSRTDCPRAGEPHSDVLPHQLELLNAREKFIALIGGYGAGKTLPMSVLGVQLCLAVPGNIGIVARRSYPKLHDSTERVFLEVLQRAGIPFRQYEMRDSWPHRIVLPHNQSEVWFRETKDPARWLGPEIGWFWVDEASEEEKKLWTDLVGRLRLPQASKFHRGLISSNPPHHQHWIPEVFGLTPGVTIREDETSGVKSKYRLIRVSSRVNPYLPTDYVANLKANNPLSEVRRIIEGEYGFTWEGKAVYMPPFSFDRHVMEISPVPSMSIVRSWDFGYHAPAVTWHQFLKCRCGSIHWLILHEYPGKDIESEHLAGIVKAETRILAPEHGPGLIRDCGDSAGAQYSEKGPGPIIRLAKQPYNLHIEHRALPNIDPGLALVREALSAETCKCGQPIFQISRTCRHTIDGLAGGYHYPQVKAGNVPDRALKPVKDGFYDNLMDTVRYAGEVFYRRLQRNPGLLDEMMRDQISARVNFQPVESDWAWMERGI